MYFKFLPSFSLHLHNSELAIAWFEMNYMNLNTDKCHLLRSGNRNEYMWAKLDNNIVWENNDVELLGVAIYKIHDICLKAKRKLSALLNKSS